MPEMLKRWRLAVAGVVCYVGVAVFCGAPAAAQKGEKLPAPGDEKPAGRIDKKKEPTEAKKVYTGVASCYGAGGRGCHFNTEELPGRPGLPPTHRGIEGNIFEEYDSHGLAYLAINTDIQPKEKHYLKAQRARQMEAILQAARGDKSYKVNKDPACLACHSIIFPADHPQEDRDKTISDGVSCVVCHGPYDAWIEMHAPIAVEKQRAWRKLSREEKEAKYGMTDLWDPAKRARLCASCHIGNHEEKKVVTHEMYAAGHPPLPGFEPAAFSNQMPRHWRLPAEMPKAVQEVLRVDGSQREQSRVLLVGAAVSLAELMPLIEGEAKSAAASSDGLDFANFDCYACHHDLRPQTWRRDRGYPGKPGRVPPRTWQTELMRLAVYASTKDAKSDMETFLAGLDKAFYAKQYGDLPAIQKAAGDLAGWADEWAAKLNALKVDEPLVKELVARLPGIYAKEAAARRKAKRYVDFDSARQIGWAFEVMYNEVYGDPGYENFVEKGSKAVRAVEQEMCSTLKLRLPRRIPKMEEEKAIKLLRGESDYDIGLSRTLRRLSDYDPQDLEKLLAKLQAVMK